MFLFLTVSSGSRFQGGGERVHGIAAKEEVKVRGRWTSRSGAQKGFSTSGFSTSQLLVDFLPQILVSSSAAGGGSLTQAGDVCLPTRRSHDALGVTTGDVVVNLSTR